MCIKSIFRDLTVCLSFANLIMLKVWLQLLPYGFDNYYRMEHHQYFVNRYLSAMFCTILISMGLLCVSLIARRWQKSADFFWPFIYGATFCFALNGIRIQCGFVVKTLLIAPIKVGTLLTGIGLIFLVTGMLFWLVGKRHMVARQYFRVPLLFAPFILITFGQSILSLQQMKQSSACSLPRQNIQYSEGTLAMPVVWIIFDELDYGIAFERRSKGLLLPQFDKLQQSSLCVTQAFSPYYSTSVSISSLLTGKILKKIKPVSASELKLTGADGTISSLQTKSTIFYDIHKRGGKTALFGWALPYSHMFSTLNIVKDYCNPQSEPIANTMFFQLLSLVSETLIDYANFLFDNSIEVSNHVSVTSSMHEDVIRYLETNQRGFTFLHYPVPHAPNIYNHHTFRYGAEPDIKERVLGNVALVDLLLGEIRLSMEKAGTWDKALVVVSADHGLRSNKYDGIIDKQHVPFLVKMPDQKSGVVVPDRFETVNTRQMVLNIVDGKIRTPEDLKSWMHGLIAH